MLEEVGHNAKMVAAGAADRKTARSNRMGQRRADNKPPVRNHGVKNTAPKLRTQTHENYTPARAARKAAGYKSAAQVAKILRCSAERIRLAERPRRAGGRIECSLDLALKLSRLYQCDPIVFLLSRTGHETAQTSREASGTTKRQ